MVLTLVDQKLRHCIGNESELAYIGCGMTYFLINLAAREMEFAGAGLHLYQIQNKKGNVLKGSLISLANSFAQEKFFNTHRLTITANEGIFLSTSGILDQVGQSEDKRFGRKSFIKLLVTLADKKSSDQYYILDKVHKEWKGMQPQTDDILVVGLRF
jgi:serine phosphatase RsbU (regulator of sigma subunit)